MRPGLFVEASEAGDDAEVLQIYDEPGAAAVHAQSDRLTDTPAEMLPTVADPTWSASSPSGPC